MGHDVFISHSTADKTVADAICAHLERSGVRCWIAPRDIRAGAEWDNAIVEAISGARTMIVVLSQEANRSRFVQREVSCAFDDEVTLIPFRVADVTPTGKMKLYLQGVHWLDAMAPPLERRLDELSSTVQALVASGIGDRRPTSPDLTDATPGIQTEPTLKLQPTAVAFTQAQVTAMDSAPDGSRYIIGDSEGNAALIPAGSTQADLLIRGRGAAVRSVRLAHGAAGFLDEEALLTVHPLSQRDPGARIRFGADDKLAPVGAFDIRADGSHILTGHEDGRILLWERTGEKVKVVRTYLATEACIGCWLWQQSQYAVSVHEGGGVALFDIRKNEVVDRALLGSRPVTAHMAPGGGGQAIVVAADDGTIQVWSLGLHKGVRIDPGIDKPIRAIRIDPQRHRVFVLFDHGVVLWADLRHRGPLVQLDLADQIGGLPPRGAVTSMALCAPGTCLVGVTGRRLAILEH
jgi:WD40 repeat protein